MNSFIKSKAIKIKEVAGFVQDHTVGKAAEHEGRKERNMRKEKHHSRSTRMLLAASNNTLTGLWHEGIYSHRARRPEGGRNQV